MDYTGLAAGLAEYRLYRVSSKISRAEATLH